MVLVVLVGVGAGNVGHDPVDAVGRAEVGADRLATQRGLGLGGSEIASGATMIADRLGCALTYGSQQERASPACLRTA